MSRSVSAGFVACNRSIGFSTLVLLFGSRLYGLPAPERLQHQFRSTLLREDRRWHVVELIHIPCRTMAYCLRISSRRIGFPPNHSRGDGAPECTAGARQAEGAT
jgi:hypothetical protein